MFEGAAAGETREKKVQPKNGQVYFATLKTEENRSGPQRHKFPPPCPKFEPLPKRFSSPNDSETMIWQVHLRINRMNQFF